MNLCSYKPLMGTGSVELFNMQTANYCVGLVNWLCPLFRTGVWSGWQIYGVARHNTDVLKKHFFGARFQLHLPEYVWVVCITGAEQIDLFALRTFDLAFKTNGDVTSATVCVILRLSHVIKMKREKKQACRSIQTISFVVVKKREKAFRSPKQLGFVWKQLRLDVWFSWKPHDREVMRKTAGQALCVIPPHSFSTTLLMFLSSTFIIAPWETLTLTVSESRHSRTHTHTLPLLFLHLSRSLATAAHFQLHTTILTSTEII